MSRSILLSLLAGALLSAQVNTPTVGFARYEDGAVRGAQGIKDSFVLGKPIAVSVDAASFSDKGGIVSAKGVIRVLRPDGSEVASYNSGEEHPVLYVSDDLSAAAWLPSHQAILRWNGAAFTSTALTSGLPGQVTSLHVSGSRAELLTQTEKAVSVIVVSLESGDELSDSLLPGVAGPAFQFKTYVLYHDEAGLEITSGGSRRTLPLPADDVTLEQMASSWLHLKSRQTNRHWAVHVTATELELSELPSPAVSLVPGGKK